MEKNISQHSADNYQVAEGINSLNINQQKIMFFSKNDKK